MAPRRMQKGIDTLHKFCFSQCLAGEQKRTGILIAPDAVLTKASYIPTSGNQDVVVAVHKV